MVSFEKTNNSKEATNNQSEALDKKDEILGRITQLTKELARRPEGFPFPGLEPANYAKLKAEDEANPGYTTPITELIQRCQKEGIKVVPGSDPESGNVVILPRLSTDKLNDGIFPRHLRLADKMDPRLRELILLCRSKLDQPNIL